MNNRKFVYVVIVMFMGIQTFFAQRQYVDIDLIAAFEDYAEMDRELVYAHLNKSTYIKGETIGIKAYVVDKDSKQLVTQAANLYCVISDADGKVIEQKLLMVENGTATGDFDIDEAYTSGNYTIKLFTNWMRNFDENNLFVAVIRIIDSASEPQFLTPTSISNVDAQFLPEGGHLLADTENVIGVVIKNGKGLGVPEIEGNIVNQKGVTVTNFKVNQFGIGRCLLTPINGYTYTAKFNSGEQDYSVALKNIEEKGVTMRLNPLKDKVALTFSTNATTLPRIQQTYYKLVIHNGKEIKVIDFKFGKQTEVVKVISNDDLFSGINIFTVFDASNNPILERSYFNFEELNTLTSAEPVSTVVNDTVSITLPYAIKDVSLINSFSVSVLPENSNSFHHQNIVSQLYLQPYLKGFVQQANYYFTNSTRKKRFELDNLLITQGWSSYDWNTIFSNPPDYDYDYESGISYTLNSTEKKDKQLMIYPSLNHSAQLVSLTKENASYTASGLFPVADEAIRIRDIESTKGGKPNLYIQFDPIKIPDVESQIQPLEASVLPNESLDLEVLNTNTLKKVEKLDEVIIKKKKGYTEIEKLQNRSLGTVEAMDQGMVKRYRTLIRYLRDKGWSVSDKQGRLEIYSNQSSGIGNRSVEVNNISLETTNSDKPIDRPRDKTLEDQTVFMQNAQTIPIVFLNGVALNGDLTILKTLTLDQIEWVETNKSGIGGGMRSGAAGLIRIKTKPASKVNVSAIASYGTYDIPLKFSVARKFYVPEYVSYDSPFFNTFGVIDWFPNVTLDANGHLKIKVPNHQLKALNVVVEGMVNDAFVSETKTIILN